MNVFSLSRNYLPLEKGGALHLNKPESPLPKDALCQVCLNLVQWLWRRAFFNFINVFSLFRYYLPLEKMNLYAFVSSRVGKYCFYCDAFIKITVLQYIFKYQFINPNPANINPEVKGHTVVKNIKGQKICGPNTKCCIRYRNI